MELEAIEASTDPFAAGATLAELVDARSMEELLSSFYALFRISVRVLNADGSAWARTQQNTAFADYLAHFPEASRRLAELYELLKHREAGHDGEFSHTSFSGAKYHVADVGHEGRCIGRIILGPFITPGLDAAPTELLACDPRLDAARARELLLGLPRVREETVRAIVRHLSVCLDLLIHAGHKARLAEQMHLMTLHEHARECSEHARHLQSAEERARDGEAHAGRVLALVGRELDAPLAGIVRRAEELVGALGLDGHAAALAAALRDELRALRGLANQLEALARARAGTLSLRPLSVDTRDVLERVAAALEGPARRRGVAIVADAGLELPRLSLDGERLIEALYLIGEAALEMTRGGEVRLAASLAASRAESGDADGLVLLGAPPARVELRIVGSGVLLSDEQKRTLFELSLSAAPDGGARSVKRLSLALAKSLITANGGTVRLEDHSPAGIAFVVALPAQGTPRAQS